MKTFLKHLALAMPLGMIGVPALILFLLVTSREFGLVKREDTFLIVTSLSLFTAIPCVCYYLIRKKEISRWVLLNWLFGIIGIMEVAFLLIVAYS